MDVERAAAKRRASFGRADRLRKEKQQKTEQTKVEERRKAERDKADQERKAEAVKAAERRNAQARKQAEQRRMERHKDSLKKEFTRKADTQQRQEAAKAIDQKQAAERDPRQRAISAQVAQQEQRQLADQQKKHRRQTERLRTEHQAQRIGFRHREAATIIQHARQIRDVDHAERRELAALDERRGSIGGRMVGLVRGAKHFTRQEQAIVERHENERWQKHRDHEVRKDGLFWAEQSSRLKQVADRANMAKAHQAEHRDLTQAHERTRPHRVQEQVKALERAAQRPTEQTQKPENARPMQAFAEALGRSHELKR